MIPKGPVQLAVVIFEWRVVSKLGPKRLEDVEIGILTGLTFIVFLAIDS